MAHLEDRVPIDVTQACSYADAKTIANHIVSLDPDPGQWELQLRDLATGGNRNLGMYEVVCLNRHSTQGEGLQFSCGLEIASLKQNPHSWETTTRNIIFAHPVDS